MKHSPLRRPAAGSRGFTLIELLVVIAIIALLVTGAFGAYGMVIEKAKKASALGSIQAIVTAVDEFQKDYDYLPQPTSATKGTDCQSDTSAEEGLIAILKGTDVTKNSRQTDYLGDIKEAKVQGDLRVDGIVRDAETLAMHDPWGNKYKVVLDLDGNGKLDNPNQDEVGTGTTELHRSVIAYSVGKDREEMTWKDNVASWGQ